MSRRNHRHIGPCFCPAHVTSFLTGGFAMSALDAEPAAAAPSLSDATPKQQSRFCTSNRTATEGLYENLQPGKALVFRGADVLTMREIGTLTAHDVTVRDGVVVAVCPTGGTLPQEAVVVASEGKTLIPGLTDIHGHLFVAFWGQAFAPMLKGIDDGSEYILPYDLQMFQLLAAGVTRTEIMAGCVDALWMRDAIRAGHLVGPNMRVGSPMIDGAPAFHSPLMSYIVGDQEGGRRAVDQAVEMGFDFIKTYSRLPASGFEGVMQACEAHGIDVMGHIPIAVDVEAALARGQHGVAHASELFYNLAAPDRTDAVRIDRIARQMAEAGTWLQTTLIVCDRSEWFIGNRPLHAPDIDMMNPLHRAMYREGSDFVTLIRQRDDLKLLLDDCYNLAVQATRAVHRAGGRILTGTDHPNPYIVDGFSLHEELERLVTDVEMTPYEALYASTRASAEYQRAGALDGMIVEGAAADLVLLDANPLDDIKATRSVNTVLRGTALLRRDKIDEGLARIRKAYAAMPTVDLNLAGGTEYTPKQDG